MALAIDTVDGRTKRITSKEEQGHVCVCVCMYVCVCVCMCVYVCV